MAEHGIGISECNKDKRDAQTARAKTIGVEVRGHVGGREGQKQLEEGEAALSARTGLWWL